MFLLSLSAESYLTMPIAIFLFIVTTSGLLFLVQYSFRQIQAYSTAPLEIASIIEMANFSHQSNSSERRKVLLTQVSDEDYERMSDLSEEIQISADNLKKELNKILVLSNEREQTRKEGLGFSARLMWLVKRTNFTERARRLDLLRTRFFLNYFELLAAKVSTDSYSPVMDSLRVNSHSNSSLLPPLDISVPQTIIQTNTPTIKTSQLKDLTLPTTIITPEDVPSAQSHGWNNVVAELQRSPLMHKRHNIIERHSARLPA